jgi:hypothetical protein
LQVINAVRHSVSSEPIELQDKERTNIMPNWCENKLTITNMTPAFKSFLEGEGGFSFERMVKPSRPETGEHGWDTVSAQADAWGTKWDLEADDAKEAARTLLGYGMASFHTAWSPPLGALCALSEMFPEVQLSLAYYEQGCAFYGIAELLGGEVSDTCSNIDDPELHVAFLVNEMGYEEDEAKEMAGIEDTEPA